MKKTFIGLFLTTIVGLFSLNQVFSTSAQGVSPTPEPTPTVIPAIATMQAQITSVETEVENLQTTPPPKDIWDKLTALSGLLSGLLVAAIGGIATYTYNERKRTADQAHNERELAIQRIQTIHNFMPQLQSDDHRAIEAAILSISTLDAKLATDLATLFKTPGAVTALSKIATGTDPIAAKQAEASLEKLFRSIRAAIITVLDTEGRPTGAGFLISPNGYIYTPDYVFKIGTVARIKHADKYYQAQVVKTNYEQGTALLKIDGDKFPFLDVSQSISVSYQEKVFSLIHDKVIGLRFSTGKVIGLDTKLEGLESQFFIATDLQSPVGSSGSPVINANGQVVGAIYAIKSDHSATMITPASQIFSLVEEMQVIEKA